MDRLEKIQQTLNAKEIKAILVTSHYNRRYITGFTGTSGAALITPDKAFFITDFRYVEQAKKEAREFKIVQHQGSIFKAAAELLQKNDIHILFFEQDFITVAEKEAMEQTFSAQLRGISGLFEEMRRIKTKDELNFIQVACEIADAAFLHLLKFVQPGMREIAVANELEFFMRKQGASSSSFEIIVASGARSALPHGVASSKIIGKNELVTLDYGCYYNGYCSDITRTIAVGKPNDKLKEIYEITLNAQLEVTRALKPGITAMQADKIARDYIASRGYGEAFGHSLGHGIGLEVHESPYLSMKNAQKLESGNVVTNEPGIYLPGIGGVRIEDDIVITETGNEVLTHSPKELIIL